MKKVKIFKTVFLTICESIRLTSQRVFHNESINREILDGLLSISEKNEFSDRNEPSIIQIINRTLKLIPWCNNCLVRSLVMKRVLRIYGIESTLRLGCNSSIESFKAHAWISVGGIDYFRYRNRNPFEYTNISASSERLPNDT
ncbi:MAG: lasso peptide biosynthesis B2 protein [SAR324 cluster bacterium]|uniref:Lasso peptide biosynthesis B2 protein n=1 Tax=SAR324 cluster bacterium TaxID=2024889 RepID=A0A7X9IKG9_9DELT|nr:lasso peptide biosynthesis B2 protein [SAR324 cluster bacterium]